MKHLISTAAVLSLTACGTTNNYLADNQVKKSSRWMKSCNSVSPSHSS